MLGRTSSLPRKTRTDGSHSGVYDEEYLEYLRQLMMSMSEHGIQGYIVRPLLPPQPSLLTTHIRHSTKTSGPVTQEA